MSTDDLMLWLAFLSFTAGVIIGLAIGYFAWGEGRFYL